MDAQKSQARADPLPDGRGILSDAAGECQRIQPVQHGGECADVFSRLIAEQLDRFRRRGVLLFFCQQIPHVRADAGDSQQAGMFVYDRADPRRPVGLKHEEADKDDEGDRHDVRLEDVCGDLEAFHGAQHRDRRRDHAVAVQQCRAEQSERHEHRAALALGVGRLGDERQQRKDAPFPIVIGAHHEQDVLDRNDQRERPEDEGQHAKHVVMGRGDSVDSVEALAERVQRAGADVAIDDADGS